MDGHYVVNATTKQKKKGGDYAKRTKRTKKKKETETKKETKELLKGERKDNG